jgi:hypothetical protein
MSKFKTPGSEQAHLKASQAGGRSGEGNGMDGSRTVYEVCGGHPHRAETGTARWTQATGAWTPEEVVLLGTDHDEVIARRIGRTVEAVRSQRSLRKIPLFRDRRRRR